MTDEEIDALMNQPLMFFRSGGGWAARATNEAQMVASSVAARAAAEAREAVVDRARAARARVTRAAKAARQEADARAATNLDAEEARRAPRRRPG